MNAVIKGTVKFNNIYKKYNTGILTEYVLSKFMNCLDKNITMIL